MKRNDVSQPGAEVEHWTGSDWGGFRWVSRGSGYRKGSQGCGIVCRDHGLGRASIFPPGVETGSPGHLGKPTGGALAESSRSREQMDMWKAGAGSGRHPLGVWKPLGTWLGDLAAHSGGRPGLVPTLSPPCPQGMGGEGTRMLFFKATGTLPVSPRN